MPNNEISKLGSFGSFRWRSGPGVQRVQHISGVPVRSAQYALDGCHLVKLVPRTAWSCRDLSSGPQKPGLEACVCSVPLSSFPA